MTRTNSRVPSTVQDYLVSNECFELVHDPDLDMYMTSPVPDNLDRYYDSEGYISHTDNKKGIIPFLYQSVKSYSLHKKEQLIRSENGVPGDLLDIGAGTADFLSLCKKRGWNVSGVEVNAKARKLANEKEIDLLEDISAVKGTYDVITLWHVLEHLPNLKETIKKLEALLTPGGTLVIAVPNFKSYDAMHYKDYWAAYDVPRHLWHFSRTSMKRLFSKEMSLKKISPMIFDSFYVSLLSEKYKSGANFSIRAIWIGFRSNMAAWRSKEYSSLIYVFKKSK